MTSLDEIYAKIPDVQCKGLCGLACGPIECSAVEVDNMVGNGVMPPSVRNHPKHGAYTCSHLDDNDRCRIYEFRPLVCRMFGAVSALRCPHGCKPVDGHVDSLTAARLVEESSDDRPTHHSAPEMRDSAALRSTRKQLLIQMRMGL